MRRRPTARRAPRRGASSGVPCRRSCRRTGPVHVLLVGEAPGPRGADKSGYPFFGDAAGRHLYQALVRMGAVTLPPSVDTLPWDGARFLAAAVRPVAYGVALGNAFDRCPTDDGHRFPRPVARRAGRHGQRAAIDAGARGAARPRTRAASSRWDAWRLARWMSCWSRCRCHRWCGARVPHPSAQGLLSMAPDRGKGATMADLQEPGWPGAATLLLEAGYPAVEPDVAR